MATLTFLVKAPVFVTREMLRHRTFRFNEESQRYHQIKVSPMILCKEI